VTNAEIMIGLTEIFRENFDDDTISLTEKTTADDIEGWDSFNHINILAATEIRFGIKFQTAEIEGLRNVGQLAQLVAEKIRRTSTG
jgi:acyl carrier protein